MLIPAGTVFKINRKCAEIASQSRMYLIRMIPNLESFLPFPKNWKHNWTVLSNARGYKHPYGLINYRSGCLSLTTKSILIESSSKWITAGIYHVSSNSVCSCMWWLRNRLEFKFHRLGLLGNWIDIIYFQSLRLLNFPFLFSSGTSFS